MICIIFITTVSIFTIQLAYDCFIISGLKKIGNHFERIKDKNEDEDNTQDEEKPTPTSPKSKKNMVLLPPLYSTSASEYCFNRSVRAKLPLLKKSQTI